MSFLINVSLLEQQNYLGLFELDDTGTLLYSRVEPEGRPGGKGPDLTGENFFEEVVPFENAEELRQRIARFARSGIKADNFIFNCRIKSNTLPVRVLLARISQRDSSGRTKSILLHIRKSLP